MKLVAIRYTDMITAAVVRSLRVFLIRRASCSSGVSPAAATKGIMLTPVSNPDSPNTSSGNARTAGRAMSMKLDPWAVSAAVQLLTRFGLATMSAIPTATITAFKARKTPTSGMATTTASLKPSRNTPPRISRSTTVISTAPPCRNPDRYGFSSMCTVASAEDNVIVMIHEVATNPSRTSTNSFPCQNGSSFSSIATDPCP